MKIPKTIGACADLLYKTREARLKLQRDCEALEEQEKALKEHLIRTLPKSKAKGVSGEVARVTIVSDEVYQVEDWDAVYAYVRKTGAFELLQKRLSREAVIERVEDGENVPGVKKMLIPKVSLNKV